MISSVIPSASNRPRPRRVVERNTAILGASSRSGPCRSRPRASRKASRRRHPRRAAGGAAAGAPQCRRQWRRCDRPSSAAIISAAVAKRSVGSFASAFAGCSRRLGHFLAQGADRVKSIARTCYAMTACEVGFSAEQRSAAERLIKRAAEAVRCDCAIPACAAPQACSRLDAGRHTRGETSLSRRSSLAARSTDGDTKISSNSFLTSSSRMFSGLMSHATTHHDGAYSPARVPNLAAVRRQTKQGADPRAPVAGAGNHTHVRHHVVKEAIDLAGVRRTSG